MAKKGGSNGALKDQMKEETKKVSEEIKDLYESLVEKYRKLTEYVKDEDRLNEIREEKEYQELLAMGKSILPLLDHDMFCEGCDFRSTGIVLGALQSEIQGYPVYDYEYFAQINREGAYDSYTNSTGDLAIKTSEDIEGVVRHSASSDKAEEKDTTKSSSDAVYQSYTTGDKGESAVMSNGSEKNLFSAEVQKNRKTTAPIKEAPVTEGDNLLKALLKQYLGDMPEDIDQIWSDLYGHTWSDQLKELIKHVSSTALFAKTIQEMFAIRQSQDIQEQKYNETELSIEQKVMLKVELLDFEYMPSVEKSIGIINKGNVPLIGDPLSGDDNMVQVFGNHYTVSYESGPLNFLFTHGIMADFVG